MVTGYSIETINANTTTVILGELTGPIFGVTVDLRDQGRKGNLYRELRGGSCPRVVEGDVEIGGLTGEEVKGRRSGKRCDVGLDHPLEREICYLETPED